MMTELEAAEARRRERAEELKLPKRIGETEDLDDAITRLKGLTIKPDQEAARMEQHSKVLELRVNWNAPQRHLKAALPPDAHPWREKLSEIAPKLGTGFLVALVGMRGTGKTQMAVELMKAQTRALRTARFCCAMDFFVDIKCTFDREKGGKNERTVINDYARPKMLVIDEMQERAETPWEDRLLTYLINRRYNDMADTLLIANQTADEFSKSVGASIASRMVETGGIIVCNWQSFRK